MSGEGNHATQATESYRPLYKINGLNGKPVVRFGGSDDYLSLPTSPLNTAFNNEAGFTIFMMLAPIKHL